tara:strand:- start:327 stop:2525 length:2199 start_codon:yes stop_codon:yes gene_type:complete
MYKNLNISIAFLLLLVILLYLKSAFFDFVRFDDGLYIFNNFRIKNFNLENALWFFTNFEWGHYFPVTMLSYGFQTSLWGVNAPPMHSLNIILHAVNCWLVYRLLVKLELKPFTILFVTALFGLHPIQIESVVWIGTRGGILSALFSLLALNSYLSYTNSKKNITLIATLAWFLFALMSKSSALTLPLIFFGLDYYKNRKIERNLLLEKVPFLTLSFIFGLIAMLAAKGLGTIGGDAPKLILEGGVLNRIFTIIYSYTFYFNFSILPFNQTAMHYNPETIDGLLPIKYYLSFLPFSVVVGYLLIKKQHTQLTILSLLFYTFSILLVINLVPLGGTIVSERYAYFTVIATFLLISIFLESILPKKILSPLSLAILLGFSITTFIKIDVWKSTYNLFENIYTVSPNTGHAINGFANEVSNKGEYQRALDLHNKILSKSFSSKYFADAASVYSKMDSTEQALNFFNSAIIMSPDESTNYFKRAYVKKQIGSIQEAVQDLNIAIRLDPMNYMARELRADIKLHLGDIGNACSDWSFLISRGNKVLKKYHSKYCIKVSDETQITKSEVKDENGTVRLNTITDTLNGDSVIYLVQYYENGNISEKGVIANGKYSGDIFWYYPSGKLMRKGVYIDVFPYGKWLEYYENGNLMAEYHHLSGVKDGTYKYFYENGSLWTEKKYEQGRLTAVIKLLDSTGQVLDKGSFLEGNGNLKIYNDKGNLTGVTTYKQGKLVDYKKISP